MPKRFLLKTSEVFGPFSRRWDVAIRYCVGCLCAKRPSPPCFRYILLLVAWLFQKRAVLAPERLAPRRLPCLRLLRKPFASVASRRPLQNPLDNLVPQLLDPALTAIADVFADFPPPIVFEGLIRGKTQEENHRCYSPVLMSHEFWQVAEIHWIRRFPHCWIRR
eukprot:284816404_6